MVRSKEHEENMQAIVKSETNPAPNHKDKIFNLNLIDLVSVCAYLFCSFRSNALYDLLFCISHVLHEFYYIFISKPVSDQHRRGMHSTSVGSIWVLQIAMRPLR